jgi:hypothetical protein
MGLDPGAGAGAGAGHDLDLNLHLGRGQGSGLPDLTARLGHGLARRGRSSAVMARRASQDSYPA